MTKFNTIYYILKKSPESAHIETTCLNLIKSLYDKLRADIILNHEKLKAFPLRSGTRQGCPPSPLVFNTVLAIAVREKKGIKGIQIVKEEVKLSLFTDNRLYVENPRHATRKLSELINDLSKVSGYKISTQISAAFLYTNNKRSEREIKEISHLLSDQKS